MRFGDGDFRIMMGRHQANHEYSDDLAREIGQSLSIEHPHYLRALVINSPIEKGMTKGIFERFRDLIVKVSGIEMIDPFVDQETHDQYRNDDYKKLLRIHSTCVRRSHQDHARCLLASKIRIAPETETFKESIFPSMGIFITSSAWLSHFSLSPVSSVPRTIAVAFSKSALK